MDDVRVHDAGPGVRQATDRLGARALTFGRHVVVAPDAPDRREVIRHELGHVAQQGASGQLAVQLFRDPPRHLLTPAELGPMTSAALHERFDAISRELALGDLRGAHSDALRREALRVGEELSQRALQHRSTFHIDDVERMKQRFLLAVRRANAGQAEECINVVRAALGELFRDSGPITMTGRNEMEGTMESLRTSGRIMSSREIPTEVLGAVVGWEAMQREASGHPSSIRDGSRRGLDEYVIYFTQTIWDGQPPDARHFPIVRLWRLRPDQPPPARTP